MAQEWPCSCWTRSKEPPLFLVAGHLGMGVYWALAAGLAAFLGHRFSPFLGFRGGKGIATVAGIVLALWPAVSIPALVAAGAFALARGRVAAA